MSLEKLLLILVFFKILIVSFEGGRYHIGADGIHAPQREDVGDVLARKEVLETWRQNVPEQVLENCFRPKGSHQVPFFLFFYKVYKRPLTPPPCFIKLRCEFFSTFL